MDNPQKCSKRVYEDRATAKKAMKELNKHHKMGITNVYYCDLCVGYHLTSIPKQSSRDYSRKLRKKKP